MNGFTDRLNQITPLNKRVFYIVWAALFIVPVLFTKIATSQYINSVVILGLQFVIVALTWKQTILGIKAVWVHFPVIFSLLVITLILGFSGARNQIYLVGILFIFSLIGQYISQSLEMVYIPIIKIKAWTIFGIGIYFSLFYFIFGDSTLTDDLFNLVLPLYRHARHFNYELIFVIPIVSYLILTSSRPSPWLWLGMSVLFMYYSLATGGRGQALAMSIIGILCIKLHISLVARNTILLGVTILLGFALVFVTSQDDFVMNHKISQVTDSSSISEMSSGRFRIWGDVFVELQKKPLIKQMTGGATDSKGLLYAMGYRNISHPHNTPLQVLIEYGYFGLALYIYLSFLMLQAAFQNIWTMKALNLVTLSSVTLIGVWVFSLTDGLFYHGIPLTMNLIFLSVLLYNAISTASDNR